MRNTDALTGALCALARDAGFTGVGPLEPAELRFEPWVREACRAGCRSYNTNWACPPAVGTLEECRARCGRYAKALLLNRVYPLEDSFDYEGMREAMADFKRLADVFEERLRPLTGEYLLLTNEGCGRCKSCTWPDAPCRAPEKLHHSLEGYGFNVLDLAKAAGLSYANGQDTVTYFGAIFYEPRER